ncbi:MAG: hypothetical protein ACJ71Q_07700 [Terriglobales bacterium]
MEQTDAFEISSVEQAIKLYVADQEARRLSKSSLRQSRGFLERQFLPWLKNRGLMRLDEIRTWRLMELQHTLNLRAVTATRRHERLRSFFRFCVINGWLRTNPMDGLKKPIVLRARPTNYFNREEFVMRALVPLMRWSGLCIKDAVMLERSALDDRGAFCVVPRPGCRSSCLCRPCSFISSRNFRRSVLHIFSGAEEVMPAAQYKDTNAAFASFSTLLTLDILMAR